MRSLIQGIDWLLDNKDRLGVFFNGVFNSVDSLLTLDPAAFKNALLPVFRQSTGLLIDFGASQFGLNKVKARIQEAVNAVPRKTEAAIRAAVRKLAGDKGGGTKQAGAGKAGDGLLSAPVELTYRNKVYVLRAVHTGSKSLVNVSVKEAGGGEKFVARHLLTCASDDCHRFGTRHTSSADRGWHVSIGSVIPFSIMFADSIPDCPEA